MYQRNIIFRDSEWKKTNIDIEVTTRNGYPELTISWECNWHLWQCDEQIKPKNEYQKELINLWDTKHLKEVDESMIEVLDTLCDNIESEESNNIITIDMLEEQFFVDKSEQLDCEVEKLMAWCLQEWVTVEWLDNIKGYWNRYTIEWNDWLICTDEEADEAHLEDVENLVNDIWFEWFHEKYISWPYVERLDNWNIEVKMSVEIPSYERANALNRYDWYEYEQLINWTTYYLYKQ